MTIIHQKKFILGFLAFLVVAVSAVLFVEFENDDSKVEVATSSQESTPEIFSVFKEVAKPLYFAPLKISFKEKTLEIEEIGVEEGGTLGVPQNWHNAGWYGKSAKAGEIGNVIIDGHYDTNTGAPAAFWQLKDLQVGDKVSLTDSLSRDFSYSVTGKSYISTNDPERARVFGGSDEKILTLITCGGIWDYTNGTYNKRLVITAVFDKMEKSW